MIKNFLDADEDDFLITKTSADAKPADENEFEEFAAPFSEIETNANLLEIPKLSVDSPNVLDEKEFAAEPVNLEPLIEPPIDEFANQAANFQSPAEKNDEKTKYDTDFFAQSPYQSESSDETIRKSGLAYSAAIILTGSIVFMLILGWFADLLLGTSPWGIVVGILLGSVIGFIQFFRTTSQILKDKD
ncbi:MAG: AtpZ/AtpI family protein [Pyrinomonadaceae bacterium]|nr:AtpZ/AtpI family protein [Pyrinomonadaceae bacterium]